VMMSMMTLAGGRRKQEVLMVMSGRLLIRKQLLILWMKMMMTRTTMMMMTGTCPNMTCGVMMRKHPKMLKMAKRILRLSSEKSLHHLPVLEADPTPEIRRKDLRDLGHLALQVALVHPDHGVEAATSLREEAANPGLKNPELEEIALDLDLL